MNGSLVTVSERWIELFRCKKRLEQGVQMSNIRQTTTIDYSLIDDGFKTIQYIYWLELKIAVNEIYWKF